MNLITQYMPQLEQDLIALHTGNSQNKQWFYQSVMDILQTPTISAIAKCDVISDVFTSLDGKLNYIKEQQQLLANLKKQLEQAKEYGKEEVSNALLSLGVSKLDGLKVSSITATKSTNKSIATLEIMNEDALLRAGYFTVVLDREAIESALLSADQREEVEEYATMRIETQIKPATIRINNTTFAHIKP